VEAFSGEADKAAKDLAKARAFNPREEETLARIAGALLARHKGADFLSVVEEVELHNKKPYVFYTELASQLDARKAYFDSEKFFKKAVELQPKLPEAQAGLGMLYMRLGREDEALKALEDAHAADKFNIRVDNTLKVLDHLKKYETIKTEHFHLRYNPKNDEVLAKYMARYLEELYKEYANLFDYRPDGPILIEVFSRHEMFSGRVVALPDLHTIGACTGRMFAMVSIHDTSKVIAKPFNWVRVLRHEMIHIFNLDQTRFQVPHWFTEGLAVTYEGSIPPPNWTQMLAEKLAADDLLNLDTVLLGFIRPRSPVQWHQAYAQSQLYTEYLTKTYGDKAVGKMLTAFGQGLDTAQALDKCVGVTKAEFEKGYRAYLTDRVKDVVVRKAAKTQTLKVLKEAQAKNPDDIDLTARLAERYLQLGRRKDAGEIADDVLRKQRDNPVALYVKAMVLIDARDQDVAFTMLENGIGDDLKDARPLKLLGKLQFEAKKFEAAARTFERCRKLEPYDTSWLIQLGKIYIKLDDKEKMFEIFKEVVKVDPDDLVPRKRLAKHYLDMNDMAEAERYARMGIEIDVLDPECQTILLQALDAQGKDAEAKDLRAIFGK
jgi:tetratricopeptide (TPR) repeat protein